MQAQYNIGKIKLTPSFTPGLYNQGDGNWTLLHNGMGAVAWGSFAANAYNRASGLGSVALGFNTIAGPQTSEAGGIDGGNVGQFSAGWASRAIGNISTATGFRNTASGQASVAMGGYNYATGDSSIAMLSLIHISEPTRLLSI